MNRTEEKRILMVLRNIIFAASQSPSPYRIAEGDVREYVHWVENVLGPAQLECEIILEDLKNKQDKNVIFKKRAQKDENMFKEWDLRVYVIAPANDITNYVYVEDVGKAMQVIHQIETQFSQEVNIGLERLMFDPEGNPYWSEWLSDEGEIILDYMDKHFYP